MRRLVTFRGSGQTQSDLLRQGGCYIRSAFKTFLFGGVYRQIYYRNVFVSGFKVLYIRLAVDFVSYFCTKQTLWVNIRNAYVSFAAQIRMYTPIFPSYTIKSGIGGPLSRMVKVLIIHHLTAVGSRLARCRIHMWDKPSSTCGCARWFFPGYSGFRPTY